MKLTDEQTRELYEFTLRKRVRYYDVQIEIVDHLACAIEDRLDREPTLPFHEALRLEYKKYGILGFSKIVTEKMKAQEKRNRLLIFSEIKSLFHGIGLLIVLSIMTLFYFLFQWYDKSDIITGSYILIGIFYISEIIQAVTIRRSKKRLLVLEKFSSESFDPLWVILWINVFKYLEKMNWMVLFLILSFICLYFIAKTKSHIKKIYQAREQYPEAFALK